MNIIVCIKPIPDNAENKEGSKKFEINAYDRSALETALRIKDKISGSQIIVLSMSFFSERVKKALLNPFRYGADRVINLRDNAFAGSDTLATSNVLEHAIRKLGTIDLVLCGKKSTDSDTSQVGPGLAEKLDLPHVTCVSKVENVSDEYIECVRTVETGEDCLRVKLPALLTIDKGTVLRYQTPALVEVAKNKEIEAWNAEYIEIDKSLCGAKNSPTRVVSPIRDVEFSTPGGLVFEGTLEKKAEETAKWIKKILEQK